MRKRCAEKQLKCRVIGGVIWNLIQQKLPKEYNYVEVKRNRPITGDRAPAGFSRHKVKPPGPGTVYIN